MHGKEQVKEENKLIIPLDVIIQLEYQGRWILYNVFTRDSLAVTTITLEVLDLLSKGNTPFDLEKRFEKTSFQVWDIARFSNYSGLLADPTRRIRDTENWPEAMSLDITSLLGLLKERCLLVSDVVKYRSRFSSKNSILDTKHFGNFHQQLGKKLLLEKRVNPSQWWVRQKFKTDLSGLNDNLYKAVQGYYLKSFFQNRFNSSHFVVDIGCGVGFYSNLIANTGAKVLGVDPNNDYLQQAVKNAVVNATFRTADIGKLGALDWIESNSADFVFMSDAFLFYFVSPDPEPVGDINVLFTDIKRILKPGGRFFSIEPHSIFWLSPWLGEKDHPFTILTEYQDKWFGVTPNISQLIRAFITGGFAIKDMKELSVDPEFEKVDSRAFHFAKKFPLWWIFELEPLK